MLTSIDVKFIFDSANCLLANLGRLGLFRSANILHIFSVPCSGCRPSRCVLTVPAMILVSSWPTSSSWNEWNILPFFSSTKTTQPCCQVLLVNSSIFWQICCKFYVFTYVLYSVILEALTVESENRNTEFKDKESGVSVFITNAVQQGHGIGPTTQNRWNFRHFLLVTVKSKKLCWLYKVGCVNWAV